MIPTRRNFLIGATASLVTAPAIVRAASLMPVTVPKLQGYMGRFLGFNIVYGASPCMVALPSLLELQAAEAYWRALATDAVRQWDERLQGASRSPADRRMVAICPGSPAAA